MFKIRLSFAFAATVAAALTTFVTVAPQPAAAGTLACAHAVDRPELACGAGCRLPILSGNEQSCSFPDRVRGRSGA